MQDGLPRIKQRRREAAYEAFCSRLPASLRDAEVWHRYLHLIRSAYHSPFAAIVSIQTDGPLVIDWVDSKLDTSFPEFVDGLEAEIGFHAILDAPLRPISAVLLADWLGIRISYFSEDPTIAVAIFQKDARELLLDTAVLHSFEKVLSTLLDQPHHHESAGAQLPWGDFHRRDAVSFSDGNDALIPTKGKNHDAH